MSFPNPLIPGFNPDPSIVRVGADYYLATSTFEYLPGIPIYHSRNLVDWQHIGNVAERVGQLAVEQVQTLGGAWAPTIRHRDGVFYVVVTDAMGRGTLIFTAANPAGPWSDGTVIEGVDGIDPDLAWDEDGTVYLTYSALRLTGERVGQHDGIEQVRISIDDARALESPRSLWSGTGLKFPEAPHIYRHGEWWYLLIAEGGTERGHAVSIARSAHPWGPFIGAPGNPLVSARSTSRPIQNTGHGDLVETPDGGWALVLLGMRPRGMTQAFSALGRETFITGVDWVGGWPVIAPVELAPRPGTIAWRDDFDAADLGPAWISVRRLPADGSSLSERPGWLVLHGDGSTLDDQRPVFVGRRQENQTATIRARIDASGGVGGVALRYDEEHHFEIEVGGGVVTARATVASISQSWSVEAPVGPVTLSVRILPPVGSGLGSLTSDRVLLGIERSAGAETEAGVETIAELDGRYLSAETAASFTGRVIGVFATQGVVAVDWVGYEGCED